MTVGYAKQRGQFQPWQRAAAEAAARSVPPETYLNIVTRDYLFITDTN